MSIKRNKQLLIVGALLIASLCYLNMEASRERRLHMMINDFLLSQ